MSVLYIVATPIGNLEDVSLRALRILKEVDFVLAEDTRVTKKLLSHYNIQTSLISYHQHSKEKKMQEIAGLLTQGRNLALVTDVGTPGISDPGNELIAFLVGIVPTLQIVAIPGASALTTLASIAGIPMDKFLFLGYPPHKKGRKKFFEEVAFSKHPVIFYELESILNTYIVVGRELTKKFETVYRGTIEEVLKVLSKEKIQGEFVVVVYK